MPKAPKKKIGKIAVVVFITLLIWVWADRALDEQFVVPGGAAVTVARSDPALRVMLNDEASVSIGSFVLKGPVSKITEVRRGLSDGSLVMEFFLEPTAAGMTTPGEYTLDVLSFLKHHDRIRQFGVTVESCEPRGVTVRVVELFKKQVAVGCIDRDQNPVIAATVTPAQVEMFVPAGWTGEAKVQMSESEIEQARLSPISKTPFIQLGTETREATTDVEITTPSQQYRLVEYTITTATLGIAMSPALQGKYLVDIVNLSEVLSPIVIRATAEARTAYMTQPVPAMTLYVRDDDKRTTQLQRRAVVYNLPPEFVRRKDIQLKNPQPVEARFRLVPISEKTQATTAP